MPSVKGEGTEYFPVGFIEVDGFSLLAKVEADRFGFVGKALMRHMYHIGYYVLSAVHDNMAELFRKFEIDILKFRKAPHPIDKEVVIGAPERECPKEPLVCEDVFSQFLLLLWRKGFELEECAAVDISEQGAVDKGIKALNYVMLEH